MSGWWLLLLVVDLVALGFMLGIAFTVETDRETRDTQRGK